MLTLVFCTRTSVQILGKTQTRVFLTSGQSLIKRNCDAIDMKLGPVTNLDKRKKKMSKKFMDDAMLENYDIIVVFPIYGPFGAIQKPDARRIAFKTYIFINSNLLSYKN